MASHLKTAALTVLLASGSAHAATWESLGQFVAQEFGDAAQVPRAMFRLVLAALLGALIGWKRERHGQVAGLRTHMLVAVGSCLLLVVTQQEGTDASSRVVQGVIAGIGFLGAGTILKHQENGSEAVHGLTAAAGIWFTAAIGIAIGLGQIWVALFCTALVLAVRTK